MNRKLLALFCVLAFSVILFGCSGSTKQASPSSPTINGDSNVVSASCGNGVLEAGENKDTCCKDAGCPEGYECIDDLCSKPAPVCGNNIVEDGETAETCCKDAGCSSGSLCQNNICMEKTTSSKEVSKMVLDLTDLPTGYVLQSREERTKSDVAEDALKLGWKTGYQVSYYKTGSTIMELTGIVNTVSVYPAENLAVVFSTPGVRDYAINVSRSNSSISFDDLSDPKIGDRSRAYRMRDSTPGQATTTYIIEFTKLDAYEYLMMSGTVTDYETLKEMAKKVELKIE